MFRDRLPLAGDLRPAQGADVRRLGVLEAANLLEQAGLLILTGDDEEARHSNGYERSRGGRCSDARQSRTPAAARQRNLLLSDNKWFGAEHGRHGHHAAIVFAAIRAALEVSVEQSALELRELVVQGKRHPEARSIAAFWPKNGHLEGLTPVVLMS